MKFVEILEDLMTQKQFNQSQLVSLIKVKQSQVCEWLKGKSKPGYDNLKAICIATGITGEEILGIK